MRALTTIILSLCLIVCGDVCAQTMIYSQNFNSGSAPEWTLNSTTTIASVAGTDNAPTGNEWLINNIFAAGTLGTATPHEPAGITGYPTSYYLHMNCGSMYSSFYGSNDNYLAGASGQVYIAAMTTAQVTTGYTNVYFSFWWLCKGDAADDGNLYYSTDGGTTWTQITGVNFYGTTTWAVDSFHLAAFDNQASLEFAFTFTDGDNGAVDPEFGIDDISLYGTLGVLPPVASFTSSASVACQDSCITFTSTTTGTVDSIAWSTTPAATIATPTATPASICFPTAGTYSVTLTAYNSGGSNAMTSIINVTPTPDPVIINNPGTQTLSVSGSYTAYQWATGSPIPSAISGATNSTYTYTTVGTYYVGVDSAGCQGYSVVPFVYTTTGVANISNTENKFWIATTEGVMNLYASQPLNDDLAINIYDATGRSMYSDIWNRSSNTKQLSSSFFPSGLYIIRLSNNTTATVFRWIK